MRRLFLGVAVAFAALAFVDSAHAQASDVQLSLGRDGHAVVPFDLRGQHIWVRGTLNGSDSLWIVVDTGASSTVMDESLARSLSIPLGEGANARGAGGTVQGHTVQNITLAVGGLTLKRSRMAALDLASLSAQGGRPMQVILGYELFQSCVVRFDYGASTMEVWDAQHAPRDLPGVTVPLKFHANHPYVDGEVEVPGRQPLKGEFVIDTGSSAPLIVWGEIATRDRLLSAFPRTLTAIAHGVGGELVNHVARADAFSIGSLKYEKPIVLMPDPGGQRIGNPGSIGNIGGQLLERCRVTFDYARTRVTFEPLDNFDRAFEADMSGAAFSRVANGYAVRAVSPDSPAGEAGLQVGDVMTSLDGRSAAGIDLAALRQRMQQMGSDVRLGIQRGSESLEVTFTLRRLL